jgi:zinc D-Ala-D-Ala carboxypeptidase
VKSGLPVVLVVAALTLVGCSPTATQVNDSSPDTVAALVAEDPVESQPETGTSDTTQAPVETAQVVEDPFPVTLHSLDDPESLWVIVNKARPFSVIDYAPADLVAPPVPSSYSPLLRPEASDALVALFDDAASAGIELKLHSSYRSYSLQKRVKADSVARFGQEVSDARSARAGHSEHQTGLVVDLTGINGACTLQACFGQTPEGQWLAENSWRHGYVLRYLEGQTAITGYIYEPWHFRYVGLELAAEVWNQGYPTLEEFFGLPPAPDYVD